MKDEQIIALYFARNEDAIGETDKKYGARLLQLAQRHGRKVALAIGMTADPTP